MKSQKAQKYIGQDKILIVGEVEGKIAVKNVLVNAEGKEDYGATYLANPQSIKDEPLELWSDGKAREYAEQVAKLEKEIQRLRNEKKKETKQLSEIAKRRQYASIVNRNNTSIEALNSLSDLFAGKVQYVVYRSYSVIEVMKIGDFLSVDFRDGTFKPVTIFIDRGVPKLSRSEYVSGGGTKTTFYACKTKSDVRQVIRRLFDELRIATPANKQIAKEWKVAIPKSVALYTLEDEQKGLAREVKQLEESISSNKEKLQRAKKLLKKNTARLSRLKTKLEGNDELHTNANDR